MANRPIQICYNRMLFVKYNSNSIKCSNRSNNSASHNSKRDDIFLTNNLYSRLNTPVRWVKAYLHK